MAQITLPGTIVSLILSKTDSPLAFERFCVKHYTAAEGILYVPTSYNYDNGRDARTEFNVRGRGTSYICSSCATADVEAKAEDDLKMLLRHDARPGKVRFCFTAAITEVKRDRILKAVRKLAPDALAEVVGVVQLEESIQRSPAAFEEVFDTELKAVERYHTLPDRRGNCVPAMRAALSTQLNPDAVALRIGILKGMILDCLSAFSPCSSQELCGHITANLALQTPVHDAFLAVAMKELKEEKLIDSESGRFRLTAGGSHEIEIRQLAASGRVLAGCTAVRKVLEQAVGKTIPSKDFNAIWRMIEDGLANLFQQHGLAIARGIAEMANGQFPGGMADPKTDLLADGLRAIASRIRMLNLKTGLATSVADVVPFALSDPESPGFEWITDLCILYIAGCSLGLDPDAQEQIAKGIRTWEMIPDTHILLSALGKGEDNHDAVKQVVDGWKAVGGQLYAAEPVVEEVGHHAEIAWRKLRQWRDDNRGRRGGTSKRSRAESLPSDNVFLRSYKHVAGPRATPGGACEYLSNFLAENERGCSRLKRVVVEEIGFELLPHSHSGKAFAMLIAKELIADRLRGASGDDDVRSFKRRCDSDGSLVAILAKRRRAVAGKARFVAIVSLSSRLRNVCERHIGELGMQSAVVSLSRLTFALALLPRASMSLAGLRAVLFDAHFGRQVSPSYELAKRVLTSNRFHRYDLSGRIQLERRMDQALAG